MPLLLSFFLLVFAAVLLAPYFSDRSFRGRVTVRWDASSDSIPPDVTVLMVPGRGYESLFADFLGETAWQTIADLFRKKAGIAVFPTGDILVVKKKGDAMLSVALHHYLSRVSGVSYTFRQRGREWRLTKAPIILEEQTMIRTFVMHDEFSRDFPEFYELIRPAMQWDWGLLHQLRPGDSISFMLRGVFDHKILIDLYDLTGLSVKSERYGQFSLFKPPGCRACEFYVTSSDMFMSPPGFFRAPLNVGRITSPFGVRNDPFNEEPTMHLGVDIKADEGVLVHAAKEGAVVETGRKRGYGNTIVIRHRDGLKTLYAHLQTVYVSPGMPVGMGDIIGTVGNSGRSTGSHLHFGVYREDKPVDPMSFTYERLWLPPFDILDRFREGTLHRSIVLEESLDRNRSFFVPETYAEKAGY